MSVVVVVVVMVVVMVVLLLLWPRVDRAEQQDRREAAAPVCWWVDHNDVVDHVWVRVPTAIDPHEHNGYGVVGHKCADAEGAHAEGTLLVVGVRQGHETVGYAVLRVRRDVGSRMTWGPIRYWRGTTYDGPIRETYGDGIEVVATSRDRIDAQAIIDRHPDLAPAVGTPMLAIYAALRDAGVGIARKK